MLYHLTRALKRVKKTDIRDKRWEKARERETAIQCHVFFQLQSLHLWPLENFHLVPVRRFYFNLFEVFTQVWSCFPSLFPRSLLLQEQVCLFDLSIMKVLLKFLCTVVFWRYCTTSSSIGCFVLLPFPWTLKKVEKGAVLHKIGRKKKWWKYSDISFLPFCAIHPNGS